MDVRSLRGPGAWNSWDRVGEGKGLAVPVTIPGVGEVEMNVSAGEGEGEGEGWGLVWIVGAVKWWVGDDGSVTRIRGGVEEGEDVDNVVGKVECKVGKWDVGDEDWACKASDGEAEGAYVRPRQRGLECSVVCG